MRLGRLLARLGCRLGRLGRVLGRLDRVFARLGSPKGYQMGAPPEDHKGYQDGSVKDHKGYQDGLRAPP